MEINILMPPSLQLVQRFLHNQCLLLGYSSGPPDGLCSLFIKFISENPLCSNYRSDAIPSPVPSSGLTTVSGIVPPKFSSFCLGYERTFKESVSKIIPSFGTVALTWLVEEEL
ncbi:hypothetical protein HAX54_046572, partial [Datura stramonium]|nr:hypothetical protein [Datura stramonium]